MGAGNGTNMGMGFTTPAPTDTTDGSDDAAIISVTVVLLLLSAVFATLMYAKMNDKRRAEAVGQFVSEDDDDDRLLHFEGDDVRMAELSPQADRLQLERVNSRPKEYEGDNDFNPDETQMMSGFGAMV